MFSVVIPLYNKSESIAVTLQSVIEQSFTNFEVIVVDDGSTDDSVSIVKQIKDNRIRIIKKQNGGVSSARNVGIENAKFEYIAFLDADDIWDVSYLETQAKMIVDFPEASMWGVGFERIYNNQHNSKNSHCDLTEFVGYVDDFWCKSNGCPIHYSSSSSVVKKHIFDIIKSFDERISYAEDLDVWWRIILNSKVAFNSHTLSYYIQDADNRAMNKKIPIDRYLPYYIDKYQTYRDKNIDFRRFFDRFCVNALYPYMLSGEYPDEVKSILSKIDFSQQKFSVKFRVRFPKTFKLICSIFKPFI